MATTTTNYGLKKPSYGDNADIAVINANMDKIDAKMKEIEDAGGGGASTWADVANKPFETVGSGLNVDESGALNATGGGGGSSVSWNQIQTSGSKIAEVAIDGTKTDVYAPTGGSGNYDTYGHVKVGSVTIDASGDDTIELVAGSNVTLTPNTTGKSVTISASGGGGTSDYLQLSNKPKINGIELVNNITTKDLGITVPQRTSELVNDSNFITNETDPTVPAWAKEPTKPTYTAEEVGALPSNTPIPDPTSVVVDRFVSEGTHIADISVNGEKTELYAPTGGGGGTSTGDMLKSEFVLSGGTGQVLSAKEADHATNTDHATNADNATTATDATYAKNLKESDGTTISAYSVITKLPKVDDNSNNIKGIIGGDEWVAAETYGTNDGLKNVCIHNNKIYSAKKESFSNIEPTAASGWNYYWEETSISALNSNLNTLKNKTSIETYSFNTSANVNGDKYTVQHTGWGTLCYTFNNSAFSQFSLYINGANVSDNITNGSNGFDGSGVIPLYLQKGDVVNIAYYSTYRMRHIELRIRY